MANRTANQTTVRDSESIRVAAATAAAVAAAAYVNAASLNPSPRGLLQHATAHAECPADAAAAKALLREMKEKAKAEGAQVIPASTEGVASSGLFVCNFSATFPHLRRLSKQHHDLALPLRGHDEDLQQLVAALGLEPLRLLTPFWLFACLRDRRVYAPDAHPLFRVSAALSHSTPPLGCALVPLAASELSQDRGRRQRVLILGCTRRLRRVRKSSGFGRGLMGSDSDDCSNDDKQKKQTSAGHALALHDAEILAACVEALGGCCVSMKEVTAAPDAATTVPGTEVRGHRCSGDLGVDIVLVGHLPGMLRRRAAPCASEGFRPPAGRQQASSPPAQRRAAAAVAELAVLRILQERGVVCVRLHWLLDAYRFGRAPPPEMYAVPPVASQQRPHQLAAVSASALRKQVFQGMQFLVSDAAVTCDPILLQRLVDLGCSDVTAIPSLLGLCPWLFRCSSTRPLAAVICGSRDRMHLVDTALQRAGEAREMRCQDSPTVFLVLQREEITGLLDLAAAAAEAVEATACSQQVPARAAAASGREASSRRKASQVVVPSSQQQQQQQKIERLLAAAQQRVLQCLPPEAAGEAQRQWAAAAAAAATRSTDTEDDLAALNMQRKATEIPGSGPLMVSSEWIGSCWEEARLLPIDSAHGCIEVTDFWSEGATSDSTSQVEDRALMAALQDCGGTVVYGELPVAADGKEARLKRALGALEQALTVSWDVQQHLRSRNTTD